MENFLSSASDRSPFFSRGTYKNEDPENEDLRPPTKTKTHHENEDPPPPHENEDQQ